MTYDKIIILARDCMACMRRRNAVRRASGCWC